MNHISRSLLVRTSGLIGSSSSWRCLSTAAARPFQVLGVQQIAVGSTDKDALRHLWVDLLGCGPVQSSHHLPKENVDEDILAVGAVEVDLMSPIDAEKKPKVRAEMSCARVP
jgi:lactoylglutathione lyase